MRSFWPIVHVDIGVQVACGPGAGLGAIRSGRSCRSGGWPHAHDMRCPSTFAPEIRLNSTLFVEVGALLVLEQQDRGPQGGVSARIRVIFAFGLPEKAFFLLLGLGERDSGAFLEEIGRSGPPYRCPRPGTGPPRVQQGPIFARRSVR